MRDGEDAPAFVNISGALPSRRTTPVTLGPLFTKRKPNSSLGILAVGSALATEVLLRGRESPSWPRLC